MPVNASTHPYHPRAHVSVIILAAIFGGCFQGWWCKNEECYFCFSPFLCCQEEISGFTEYVKRWHVLVWDTMVGNCWETHRSTSRNYSGRADISLSGWLNLKDWFQLIYLNDSRVIPMQDMYLPRQCLWRQIPRVIFLSHFLFIMLVFF